MSSTRRFVRRKDRLGRPYVIDKQTGKRASEVKYKAQQTRIRRERQKEPTPKPRKRSKAFVQAVDSIGLEKLAERLGRSVKTVQGWKGRPPPAILPTINDVLARHVRAKKSAETRQKYQEIDQAEREAIEREERLPPTTKVKGPLRGRQTSFFPLDELHPIAVLTNISEGGKDNQKAAVSRTLNAAEHLIAYLEITRQGRELSLTEEETIIVQKSLREEGILATDQLMHEIYRRRRQRGETQSLSDLYTDLVFSPKVA